MKALSLVVILLISLPTLFAASGKTYSKLKDFGKIVITTQERYTIDLNSYFAGSIDSFKVDLPFTVLPKFQITNDQKKFFTADTKINLIDAPKDSLGNWDKSKKWLFLDHNNALISFTQSGSSDYPVLKLSKSNEKPFYGGKPSDYDCGSMVRLTPQILAISCSPKEETSRTMNFFVDVDTLEVKATMQETQPGNQRKWLEVFSTTSKKILISYPNPHHEEDNAASNVALYDVTDYTKGTFLQFISADYFGAQSFIVQRVIAVGGKSLFFADKGGAVYRVDNPLSTPPGDKSSFSIVDGNILDIQVALENYHGQPQLTLVVHTPAFIYYVDWTISSTPVAVNKYSLSLLPGKTQKVIAIETSQFFLTTIVRTEEKNCTMLTYYLGPNLPGDVYYKGDCPINTSLITTQRSADSFFFLEGHEKILDYKFSKFSQSLLQINSTKTGEFTPSLFINGDEAEVLNVLVIDPKDYNVYISRPSQQSNFGFNVPGKTSFDITSLLNGPFLTYTSNDPSYTILPAYENVTFAEGESLRASKNDEINCFYSNQGGSTVKWFSGNGETITLKNCVLSAGNYKCTSSEGDAGGQIATMAASDKYVFAYLSDKNSIAVLDHTLKEVGNYDGPPDDDPQPDPDPENERTVGEGVKCEELVASQPTARSPFLYCLGAGGVYLYDTADLTQKEGIKLEIGLEDFTNSSIVLNYNFPSMLFLQVAQKIYLVDSFVWQQKAPNPVISTISIPDPKKVGYTFGVGGKSLLVYLQDAANLLEYDVSYPRTPVLIKTLPYKDYTLSQILSDSQQSDNIYIYGQSIQNHRPYAVVYRPQMPGASNYLTAVPLPNPPFDPAKIVTYPTYPAFKKSDQEDLFIIPIESQLGWNVRSTVQVSYSNQAESDPSYVDYEITVPVLITGTHPGKPSSSSVTQISVNLILTDESARATHTLVYTGVNLTKDENIISFDPRKYFNGTITKYLAVPQDQAEAEKVELIQQVTKGDSLTLEASDIVGLSIGDKSFIAQTKTSIMVIAPDGKTTTKKIESPSGNTLTCNDMLYNSYIKQTFSVCQDTKTKRYNFAFATINDGGVIGPVVVDSEDTGKVIKTPKKTIFTASAVFIHETVDTGSVIHVFFFKAPQTLTYATTITSAEFNTPTLSISDMTINYRGETDRYRLFLMDPGFGLRTLDLIIQSAIKTIQFFNPQYYTLPGPSNVIWDHLINVGERGDLGSSLDLVISSSNYKTYFLKFVSNVGLTLKRVFVATPKTSITKLCYADGNTFIASAYDGSKNYALLYSISDLTIAANGQNFPLFSVQYTPTATGGCSIAFNPTAEKGPSFYANSKTDLSSYIVKPNITMKINGELDSKYITITGEGPNHKDSFQFYLVRPDDDNRNYLFLFVIIGGVGALILISLICVCIMKMRKSNRNESTVGYSHLRLDDESSFN